MKPIIKFVIIILRIKLLIKSKRLNEFIKNGSLGENAALLNVPNVRQLTFYVLPKIHKKDNPGRPIVTAVSCPKAHISTYIDCIFQPLVQS